MGDELYTARAAERAAMVREHIAARDVRDPRVLAALGAVPRELFVPPALSDLVYADRALPIDRAQTISQPFIVALMSELAGLSPGDRVLEIGTGSGYQSAVLAHMGVDVYTVERHAALQEQALRTLGTLGLSVHARVGDGYAGWPEAAPFAAILVTAAPPELPGALVEQLGPGGRLVVPIGDDDQVLEVIRRGPWGLRRKRHGAVRFVPMVKGPVDGSFS